MRVKICGITRLEDGILAQELGAWALGFIMTPKSTRYATPEVTRDIALQTRARCVGVFVDQTDELINITQHIPLAGVQLHGNETPDDCRRVRDAFGGFIIKALKLEKEQDLDAVAQYKDCVDYVLIDSCVNGEFGGTGQVGNWTLAARAVEHGIPLILAGGLNAGNILNAAGQVKFFAADLSSGVEASLRIKDVEKMKTLFEVVNRSQK